MTEEVQIEVEDYRLFLDLSSQCSGYVVARIKKGKSQQMKDSTCEIVRAGAIWYPASWENVQKYAYMYRLITEDFYVTSAISDIVYERYSFSMNQRSGSLVVPEMIGAIKAATHDVAGLPLGIEDIPPQTWRSQIGLKADKDPKTGKRDFKTPCIAHFDKMFDGKIPETLISNVTGKERKTPNDLYDALGVCVGWHKKMGVNNFTLGDIVFNCQVANVMDL